MNKRNKAILYMLISTFSFSLMALAIKFAGDISIFTKTAIRTVVIAIISFSIIKHNNHSLKIKEAKSWLFFRCLFGTLAVITNYYAIDHLVISDASIIFKLSTPFLIIICIFLFNEKVTKKQILSITIAFIGTIFVIKPTFNVELFPFIICILSALLAALAYAAIRGIKNRIIPIVIVFYFSIFSTITLTPFMILNFKPISYFNLIILIFAGIFAMGGQYFLTESYSNAPAKEVSIYSYYSIVLSSIYSIFIFDIIPDIYSIIGYIIIFASSYYMYIHRESKN